ncbi:nitrogen regulation protein NR(I) [Castellaniella sp.]|uniref:nitrogen regulation protein NR(I) n=1 Tax=Castellaniella sp. TaxID=1955812 RepID=UPI003C7845D8
MNTVWIADDEPGMRWVLDRALKMAGWEVRSFETGTALLDALGQAGANQVGQVPAVLVCDVRMPGPDGLAVLTAVRQQYPQLPVILMTAYTDLETTVAAFQQGAFDYLAKPFDIQTAVDLISRAARSAAGIHSASAQKDAPGGLLANQTASHISGDGPETKDTLLPSQSPAMQEVFRAIGRLARTSATVLITGESGTGKELVAHALHQHSLRAQGPFVAVNAAAIPHDLLEAELFGHERGAFTGAVQARRGRFEEAHGGTLFLDEIGDMPADLQTRLLRVLADNSFYRVGGRGLIQVDVRIIAATHQPLEERVEAGLFRADLFHRLNVIRLRLPALRERPEDIPELARCFLLQSAASLGLSPRSLHPDALQALQKFSYPGNIRQLQNICQWLTVMTASALITLEDLPPDVSGQDHLAKPATGTLWQQALEAEARARLKAPGAPTMASLQQEIERLLLVTTLEATEGRRGKAAEFLGIGRNTLSRKCRELGLDFPDSGATSAKQDGLMGEPTGK